MKWKLKVKEPKQIKSTIFLFTPRYCDNCGDAYWLEYRKLKNIDYAMCDCGERLSYTTTYFENFIN